MRYYVERHYSVFRLSRVLIVSGMEHSGFPETLYLIQTGNAIYKEVKFVTKFRNDIEYIIFLCQIQVNKLLNFVINLLNYKDKYL